MKRKVSNAAASLLAEAGKHKSPARQNWLTKLTKDQQEAIKQAYHALPGSNLSLLGLTKAIRKAYGVKASDSAIRMILRGLDT